MNSRERFRAVMHYQPADHCPMIDSGFWDETLAIWRRQGMPKGIDPDEYFEMDIWEMAPINVGLCPEFAKQVIEDYVDTQLVRDGSGVLQLESKVVRSTPHPIDHTLKDRETWESEFKWRLDGARPERYPENWPQLLKQYADPSRDHPIGLNVGSLYGWPQSWMGVENLSCLTHDDPDLFTEIVDTIAECVIKTIKPALDSGLQFDYARFWENLCYRGGPVIAPALFRQFLTPAYRRITDLLAQYGIDIVMVNCNGDISSFIPMWMDAGINTLSPVEVGGWGGDPIAYRRQFGHDLRLIGGFSRKVLTLGREAITEEIERLAPLVCEGGFIPVPDRRVPPDVTLADFRHYLAEARGIWAGCVAGSADLRSGAD